MVEVDGSIPSMVMLTRAYSFGIIGVSMAERYHFLIEAMQRRGATEAEITKALKEVKKDDRQLALNKK